MRLLVLLLLLAQSLYSQTVRFPLKASSNKKYLAGIDNTPVYLNGCASWRLLFALRYDEAEGFLKDRKSAGFNAFMVQILPDPQLFDKGNSELKLFLPFPFTGNDISKPNESYFRHADSILELCNKMNVAVLAAPLYLGCCQDGWLEIIQADPDGVNKCRNYGTWIANRYKHLPNIIWVSGGDHDPVPEAIAFAEGIAAADTIHLHSFHAHPGKSSGEKFKGTSWHTLSFAYTYFPALEMNKDWQYKQVYAMFYEENLNNYGMPVILAESAYEDERNATTQIIRRQAYWSLLSGASGNIYGQNNIWRMDEKWKSALKKPGAESMGIFYRFVQSIPWYNMKADWAHTLVTGGRGNFNSTIYPGGEDYATAALSNDSAVAAIYMPSYRKVCVNMKRFKNRMVNAKWYDPSSGKYKLSAVTYRNEGVEYFTPPAFKNEKGFDDWVLVLISHN